MRLPLSLLIAISLVLPLAGATARAASTGPAQSGHVIAKTTQTVAGRTRTSSSDLWFTRTTSRLTTRQGDAPSITEVYDGKATYRWREGARAGQVWHPLGLRVLSDVVAPLMAGAAMPGRKKVGTGTVVGLSCVAYQGKGVAPEGTAAWWRGTLDVRVWESRDPRFPYVVRLRAADKYGNKLESDITLLKLNVPASASLFKPPSHVAFMPPPQVLRGRQVAGGLQPLAAPVAVHLADPLPRLRLAPGRQVVTFDNQRYALDRTPIVTDRDVQEARLEPYGGSGSTAEGEALVLYLKSASAAKLAKGAAAARGRTLLVLIVGQPVAAERLAAAWAVENNRVPIYETGKGSLTRLAERLRGSKLPPGRK